jgi:general secretion pathway protein D
VKISSVTGLVRLLAGTTQAQILHTPQILTSDNVESEIKVTNKIKTATTTTTNSGGTLSQSQSFETQQVVLSLKVKPQIGEDNDLIKLEVDQSIDNFAAAAFAAGQVDVTERKVKNTVVVRNGDSVVVGGLQKTDVSDVRSKVPFLGDIPILGWLFKGKKSENRRANLILFLTPHIIKDYSDLLKITGRKIDERLQLGKIIKDPPKDIMKTEIEEFKKRNEADLAKPQIKAWNFAPKPSDETEENPAEAKADKTEKAGDSTPSALKSEQPPSEKL